MTFKFLAAAVGGLNVAMDKQEARAKEETVDRNLMNISYRK
jgi:hypothetical protein